MRMACQMTEQVTARMKTRGFDGMRMGPDETSIRLGHLKRYRSVSDSKKTQKNALLSGRFGLPTHRSDRGTKAVRQAKPVRFIQEAKDHSTAFNRLELQT
jgi:hypothetical protein